MEKRTLLAIVLSLMVILIYQYFFVPEPAKPPLKDQKVTEESSKNQIKPSDSSIISKALDKPVKQEIVKLLEEQQKEKPKDITIETEKYTAVINTDGAKITSWKLKDYYLTNDYENVPWKMAFWNRVGKSYKNYFYSLTGSEKNNEKKENIDLFQSSDLTNVHCLQLMKGDSIEEGNEKDSRDIYNGIFHSQSAENIQLNSEHPKQTVTLSFLTSDGFQIDKIFTFYHDTYQFDVEVLTKNLKDDKDTLDFAIVLGPGLGNSFQKGTHKYEGPVSWIDGKKKSDKPIKNSPFVQHQGNVAWTAMTSNYFVAAVIPQKEESQVLISRPAAMNTKDATNINRLTTLGLHYPAKEIAPGAIEKDTYKFYFGPKKFKMLENFGIHLEQVVDYGFFSFLAKPLIWLLNWFYGLIPNYGIAIILLTILIKIAFWPLTDKSFRSMKQMQEVQPKLSALRDKYKSDPKKLNDELMAMYKEKGINPMGGCLPLLLQIPVFFALYEGLMVAIELRGAPFMFWIKDLSVMDPLLITPILMGVTMYAQQKMTPMAGDAAQIKMMMMMPLIFTVFFLGFPSGLVIYWLMNNVLTVGQHYLILKKMNAVKI